MSQHNLGRLTKKDQEYLPGSAKANPNTSAVVVDSKKMNSFNYDVVTSHIHVQRANHQCASKAYQINQAVKHSYEDGHMSRATIDAHTKKMDQMSDTDAFEYAKKHLHFEKTKK